MVVQLHVLPLEGVSDIGLACLLDAFALANRQARADGRDLVFDLRLVGVAPEIRTGNGLRLPLEGPGMSAPDWVLIPALGALDADDLDERLAQSDARVAAALLRDYARRGARLAAACTGGFLLAEAGLLDGHNATTSWWLAENFRARYPAVALDETRTLVESGACVSAGAAMAHLDLALWLVRRTSPVLAERVARYLAQDARATEKAFPAPQPAFDDPVVLRFEDWARAHLAEGFSLAEAAHAAGASERTLTRRLRGALGKSALAYFQDLRIERAVHLLKTSRASVDDIAAAVGYADGKTLRSLLRKKTGHGTRALREARI
jgi:transcriptional regulator GlxA family with amidase domain